VQAEVQQTPSTHVSPLWHCPLVAQGPPTPSLGTQTPLLQLAPSSQMLLPVQLVGQIGAVWWTAAEQNTES
jgi:hypothetical protein